MCSKSLHKPLKYIISWILASVQCLVCGKILEDNCAGYRVYSKSRSILSRLLILGGRLMNYNAGVGPVRFRACALRV